MNRFTILVSLLIWVLVGCASESAPPETAAVPPTVIALLETQNESPESLTDSDDLGAMAQPTVANVFQFGSLATPIPTPIRGNARSATDGNGQSTFQLNVNSNQRLTSDREIVIFDDELDSEWSLENSNNVEFDVYDTAHWFEALDQRSDIHSGAVSIAITPETDFGSLFFTVRPEAQIRYPRDQILGVSFWINSGLQIIDGDALSISIVGSNLHNYWLLDDYSVFQDTDERFQEATLDYLEVNRAIPPETWVNVVVWLDKLIFDPDYLNITGFYIKNDAGFRSTYYIDRVSLIMQQ